MGALNQNVELIQQIVQKQNTWRKKECINLIASENVTSPSVDAAYQSDFSHRYAEGDPGARFYNGTKYADEIESLAMELAKKVFKTNVANLQVISGTVANFAALAMFTQATDTIISNSTSNGGHISHNPYGAAGLLSTNVLNFPVTEDGYHIDADKTNKLIKTKSSNIRNHLSTLLFGCSMYLFPQPVKEIAPTAKENNLKIIYDAAHVLGLIGGGKFQDPLREGADLVTASTHKTFFGPQGGIILSNMEESQWKKFKGSVFPGVVSNYNLHRFPALAMALLEFQEFGEEYAEQVLKNAKALAQELHALGFNVQAEEFGFTQSHQCIVEVSEFGGGKTVGDKLEENNIILNKNLLPNEKITMKSLDNPSGIRIGVQEMTHYGMKEEQMKVLAGLISKALKDDKNVKDEVIDFRKQFLQVQYTFK